MYVVLGGTGNVGSAVAEALAAKGEQVIVVTRSSEKHGNLAEKGIEMAAADVRDTDSLRRVFKRGKRLFLLNPPADPSSDVDSEERKAIRSIVSALDKSGLEKIVAQSTYGAQHCDKCGDLGVLYELEQSLKEQPISTTIIRAAYFMSNWEMALETAAADGVVHSFFASDFELPMVAPKDLGRAGARFLTQSVDRTGTHYIEGPQPYSPADVAGAFSAALDQEVTVQSIPSRHWTETFKSFGFSDKAAKSYAGMTAKVVDGEAIPLKRPERGDITLEDYVSALVKRAKVA